MKKNNTVYEDKAEKEEHRRLKRQAQIERHKYPCPHCGKSVLDHMTQCPHCGGKLETNGYRAPDEKKLKTIKLVCYIVGFAVAIALVAVLIAMKQTG